MGSDLSMEANSFRPGPAKVQWLDDETILVETEVFYHGYREFYRGPVTAEVERIFKTMGITIPKKPLPKMPEAAYKVFHRPVDYNGRAEQPIAIFEDQAEAVEYAKKQKGYGYNIDWFVVSIPFYRKDSK